MNDQISPADQVRSIHRQIDAGQLEPAGAACERLVEAHPDYGPGWMAFSELWLQCGEIPRAGAAARRALDLEPESIEFNNQFAKCLLMTGDETGALQFAQKSLQLGPTEARQLDTLGNLFSRCGDNRTALALFARACQADPNNPHFLFNLANSLRVFGETDKSEAIFDEGLKRAPDDAVALYQRSQLRTQTAERNHAAELEAARETAPADSERRVMLSYALAKELEDLERYPESFRVLTEGAAIRHRRIGYTPDADLAAMKRLGERDVAANERGLDAGQSRPIFVLGMPRSGTSLVEKIIASHDDVRAGGELREFQLLLARATGAERPDDLLTRAAESDPDLGTIGTEYLERARQRFGEARIFTDKMPLNALYAGLIHEAIPGARIVLLDRHPMDSCYAVYKHLFAGNTCPFSYALDTLARFYAGYRELMTHWTRTIPASSLMVCAYEDLVESPREAVQKLLAFCDLSWQDQCLEFHRQSSGTATGSASQVNQPIYAGSVGRWQHYETELQPVRDILEAKGIDLSGRLDNGQHNRDRNRS